MIAWLSAAADADAFAGFGRFLQLSGASKTDPATASVPCVSKDESRWRLCLSLDGDESESELDGIEKHDD